MQYRDLRDSLAQLERTGELRRIHRPVSPRLGMTEVCDRLLRAKGPTVVFEQPMDNTQKYDMPVLANLFGTTRRVALGMGAESLDELRDVGRLLSALKEPEPPRGLCKAGKLWTMAKVVWDMAPRRVSSPACQEIVWEGNNVDLSRIPVQTYWPDDAAPLATWGLVIARGPHKKRQNLGIYRQQVISHNQLIMRQLAHRGGALDFREHVIANPGQPSPIVVALGADPATILGAMTPVPDTLSEYQFAGLLHGSRIELVTCLTSSLAQAQLQMPAGAEITLEGHTQPDPTYPSDYQHALEGPFGDHTGYYNEQDWFPVFTVERITTHRDSIYRSTYTDKPSDESTVLGVAPNEVFVPLLQKQFPEIAGSYLPPEGCSYRMALIGMKKQYTGHAKRVMSGVWSFLWQFIYAKLIVVVDDNVNLCDWREVIWAVTTRVDPACDTVMVENTPIDYPDSASPVSGLSSEMGIDATNKWPGETTREWSQPIVMNTAVKAKVDAMQDTLFQ